jgi:hypothetical protein
VADFRWPTETNKGIVVFGAKKQIAYAEYLRKAWHSGCARRFRWALVILRRIGVMLLLSVLGCGFDQLWTNSK